jgi:hypothetical protein
MKAQELADESRLLGFVFSSAAPRLEKGVRNLDPEGSGEPLFLLGQVA